MFHLIELIEGAMPPRYSSSHVELGFADGAGEHSYVVTSDERPISYLDDPGLTQIQAQRLRLLRQLVEDANNLRWAREALDRIANGEFTLAVSARDAVTAMRDVARRGLAVTMPDSDLNAALTSDKVLNGLARDIAGPLREIVPGSTMSLPGRYMVTLECGHKFETHDLHPRYRCPHCNGLPDMTNPDALARESLRAQLGIVDESKGGAV